MTVPATVSTTTALFAILSDDVVLNILSYLEADADPRHLSRLACVSRKFSSLIRTVSWRSKCYSAFPSVLSDLLPAESVHQEENVWSSLYKLSVSCPGLFHSGVLLDHSDFGLDRELGPTFIDRELIPAPTVSHTLKSGVSVAVPDANISSSSSSTTWSLFDDMHFDTVYLNTSEVINNQESQICEDNREDEGNDVGAGSQRSSKRRKICPLRSSGSHLASGAWNLCREQGNKLLASRFRGDVLYICDWPGCVHIDKKRNYMLFRGVFKNFKQSRVWRTINDGNRNKIDVNCAFCDCKQTWDLHSSFCLRRFYGHHDDGEPVVRAYVCENGHVSGAWTDWPLYT